MTATATHLLDAHVLWLVVVGALVCHAACYATLDILRRVAPGSGRIPFKRLVLAAVTFGFGIWAAHFIAVLAFEQALTMGYDVVDTLLSIAIGVVGSLPGLALFARRPLRAHHVVAASFVLGGTIAALHFTGMSAVRLQGRMSFDRSLVVASILVAIVFCGLAAVVARDTSRLRRLPLVALLLVAAIYGLHMTAVAAITVTPDPSIAMSRESIAPDILALLIGTATLVVMAIGTGASLIDEHLASRMALESARFRHLADATSEGIIVHREGIILELNGALSRLVGRTRAQMIGRPLTDVMERPAAAVLTRALGGAAPIRDEVELQTPDGPRRTEIFTREAEYEGAAARISAIRDITQRRRDEVLRDAEKRMLTDIAEDRPLGRTLEFACATVEAVLPGSACSVLLLAADGLTLRHAAAPTLPEAYCASIDGLMTGPAVGSCGTAAWSGQEVIVEDIATDPLWSAYKQFALPHGLSACWSIPLKSQGGAVLGTFATYHPRPHRPSEDDLDVVRRLAASSAIAVQRKRQDEALVAEKEKAQAASRAKSEFLASMSHELRTPLNAILGFSEVIEHQLLGAAASKYADYAADIHRSGRHLLDLINDLLDVARIESGKLVLEPERCDLASIVGEQVAMVRRAFPDAARIDLEGAWACPAVLVDARAVGQILLNVVGNAAKFTPREGRITIAPDWQAPGFRVVVTDNGPGIAPELLADIGQAFRHGEAAYSRRYGGTGLGLHISGALMTAHGGRIDIASVVGRGTTVTIALPEALVLRDPVPAVTVAV